MKICQDHWNNIRLRLDELGLTHLISKDGHEAVQRAVKELEAAQNEEKPEPDAYDPLMAMFHGAMSMALNSHGLGAMHPEYGCIFCHMKESFDAHNTPTGRCDDPECSIRVEPGAQSWDQMHIETGCQAQLDYAKKIGLVRVQ